MHGTCTPPLLFNSQTCHSLLRHAIQAVVAPSQTPAKCICYPMQARHNSLTHVIDKLVAPSAALDALKRPAPAHRLDRVTGGVIVFVKTGSAARHLRQQFDEGSTEKRCAPGLHAASCSRSEWRMRAAEGVAGFVLAVRRSLC